MTESEEKSVILIGGGQMIDFDCKNMETDDLLSMADKVLTEIERRMELEELEEEDAERSMELLKRIIGGESGQEVYTLEVTIEDNGFCLEWKAGDKGFVQDWQRTDGGKGAPDEDLLKRNPTLWLMNIKLGKYEAEQV